MVDLFKWTIDSKVHWLLSDVLLLCSNDQFIENNLAYYSKACLNIISLRYSRLVKVINCFKKWNAPPWCSSPVCKWVIIKNTLAYHSKACLNIISWRYSRLVKAINCLKKWFGSTLMCFSYAQMTIYWKHSSLLLKGLSAHNIIKIWSPYKSDRLF